MAEEIPKPDTKETKEFYEAQRAKLRLAEDLEKARKRRAGPQRLSTAQDVADIVGVTTMTISRWVNEGLPCDEGSGGRMFDAGEVLVWGKANNKTFQRGRPSPNDPILLQLRIEKERELVERFRRENKLAAGLVIDAVAEEKRVNAMIVALRNRFAGLFASLSARLAGLSAVEIQTIGDAAVEKILNEFAGGHVQLEGLE